ncbi:unnamed protein product [Ilex paraguariensis]|uniref:Eukaryotic translation initiation factor 2A n=1 Tax=Ilex paraguariensis TaxID=185542 RepID=A0ABC8SWU2_9AQUA
MAVADPSPSLEILVREPVGFALWTGPPFTNAQPNVKIDRVLCTSAKYSEDGSTLMAIKSDSVISIFDCKSSKERRNFEALNILAAILSPCGTYLQTFQKPLSPQEKNVTLWKTVTGDAVYHLFQKNMTTATWPSVRFSFDEVVACRMATNEIQFFDTGDFSKGIIHRLRVPGVAAVELSKTPGSYVAAFVPESKTFQKPLSPQEKNVTLWKTVTGDAVYHLFQKNMTTATWPSVRFSFDEVVACRMATNEIQFFDTGDFSKGIIHRLRVPGVAAVELSKTPGSYVAAFVPESKVCSPQL